MSRNVCSPLVDVAMGYVNDLNISISQENYKSIRFLFEEFINETISYERILHEMKKHLPNLVPLHKICSIMNLTQVHETTTMKNNENNSQSNSATSKNRKKTRCWSFEEDQRLLMGVHLYGLENWSHVAEFVGNNRTRSMCSQRWLRVLDPKISKNQWNENEDIKLMQLIDSYGTKSWMKIASKLGNRSDVQCRYRYKQLIFKDEKKKSLPLPMIEDKISDNSPSLISSSNSNSNDSDFSDNISNNVPVSVQPLELLENDESNKKDFWDLDEFLKLDESFCLFKSDPMFSYFF